MSSLDSQFVCLGSMFTNDIVIHATGRDRFTDRQIIMMGRMFIVFVVAITFVFSLFPPPKIFNLAVWCFSGFASLFPIVFAALYWKRVTKTGAIASILAMTVVWFVLFYQDVINPSAERIAEGGDYLVWVMMPVAITFAVSSLPLLGVLPLPQPSSEATIEKFFDLKAG